MNQFSNIFYLVQGNSKRCRKKFKEKKFRFILNDKFFHTIEKRCI